MHRKEPPISAFLNFNLAHGTQHRVSLDRPTFICRTPMVSENSSPPRAIYNPACTSVFIDSPEISNRHAEIYFEEKSWMIRDLNSLNGTFVNNAGLERPPIALHHGDRIAFARSSAVFGQTFDAFNTALIVGNPSPDLMSIENDLTSMNMALMERKHFSGRIRTVYGSAATKERLKAESIYLSQYTSKNSLSIFYFNGHGEPQGFILPGDHLTPKDLFSYIQFFQGKKLVLLDCCYATNFLPNPPPDTLIITGESSGNKLYEGKVSALPNYGQNLIQGYLTRAFVKMLEESPLEMELRDIAEKMEKYYKSKVHDVKIFAVGTTFHLRSAIGLKQAP